MSDLSRREFLRKGSLGVAAGVVAAELATNVGIAKAVTTHGGEAASSSTDETATEPVVAYVKQGSRGEVRVMVGSREIVHRDAELARRILRAAR
jgi:hypothetical protein